LILGHPEGTVAGAWAGPGIQDLDLDLEKLHDIDVLVSHGRLSTVESHIWISPFGADMSKEAGCNVSGPLGNRNPNRVEHA
jgi:hypothetical protein